MSTSDLDLLFAYQNSHVDLDHTLNDGSFADLSEALIAANAATSYFNEHYMTDQTLRDFSNNSTASSSPFTPGPSVLRPKLGSRFSREVIRTLKDWLAVHQQHPYPNENEMLALQSRTGLNKAQLTNWFANARRRGKVQSVRPGSPQVREKPTSPIDIIHRPGTPAVRSSHDYKDPMQRWVESPPEHEPAAVSDIARAMASTSCESSSIPTATLWLLSHVAIAYLNEVMIVPERLTTTNPGNRRTHGHQQVVPERHSRVSSLATAPLARKRR
jgi:hypothetical protein